MDHPSFAIFGQRADPHIQAVVKHLDAPALIIDAHSGSNLTIDVSSASGIKIGWRKFKTIVFAIINASNCVVFYFNIKYQYLLLERAIIPTISQTYSRYLNNYASNAT